MYAIINSKTNKFVYGTDKRNLHPITKTWKQCTSFDRALTYDYKEYAESELKFRRMSKIYKVVEVKIVIIQDPHPNKTHFKIMVRYSVRVLTIDKF